MKGIFFLWKVASSGWHMKTWGVKALGKDWALSVGFLSVSNSSSMHLQMSKINTEPGLTHTTRDLQSLWGTWIISNGGEQNRGGAAFPFSLLAFKY